MRPDGPRSRAGGPALWAVGAALVVAAAFALRFGGFGGADLNHRVLHGDEAVNAIKAAQAWHRFGGREYTYDPYEFHGPTLPQLSRPILAANAESIHEVDERTLRLLPAFAGVVLVLLTLLAVRDLGRGAAWGAALATALSAAMVFYSRYYIHEMLLVVFTFAAILCGSRLLRGPPRAGWAAAFGLFVGLMHATKETFVIPMFSMVAAAGIVYAWRKRNEPSIDWRQMVRPKDMVIAAVAATLVSVAFYSNFFTYWRGPLDSLLTYKHYLMRSGGHRGAVSHEHPFGWYLSLLLYRGDGKGAWFSELPILLLAGVGAVAAVRGRGWGRALWPVRFLALYTVLMVGIYSLIPYKTPWSMLGFLHGLCLMAGIGAVGLWRDAPGRWPRFLVTGLLVASVWVTADRSVVSNFQYATDPRNPYVYAHPSHEVRKLIAALAEDCAAGHPTGYRMPVLLVGDENPWPLPYYLRRFEKLAKLPASGPWPDLRGAPFVICDMGLEDRLLEAMGGAERYKQKDAGLRHGVHVVLLIRKDVFASMLEVRQRRLDATAGP